MASSKKSTKSDDDDDDKKSSKKGGKKGGKYAARLKGLAKHWKGAREGANSGGFENLEEGKYIAWLQGEIGESGSGRLQIHWKHTVARGEEAGQVQHSYDGLETPENLTWLARKFSRLGYEVEGMEIEELEEILDEINEECFLVQIQVKENGDFVNTYVNKLLDPDDFDDLESLEDLQDEKKKSKKDKSKKSKSKAKDDDEDDEDEDDEDDQDDDDDDEEEKKSSKKSKSGKKPPGGKGGKKSSKDSDDDEDDEDEDDEDDEEDLDDLGDKADHNDKKAIKRLKELCDEHDVDHDSIKTWPLAVKALKKAMSKVSKKSSSKKKSKDDDEDDEDDAGEKTEITKGSGVWFVVKGKPKQGKVKSIKGDVAKVELENGDVVEVDVDRLENLDDVPF